MASTQQQSAFHRTVAAGALNVNSADQSQTQLGNVSPRQSEANSVKDYIAKLKGQLNDAYE